MQTGKPPGDAAGKRTDVAVMDHIDGFLVGQPFCYGLRRGGKDVDLRHGNKGTIIC